MRFTLTYDGTLPSRGSATRKQAIRETFHPQLQHLWTFEPLASTSFLNADAGLSVLVDVDGSIYAPLVHPELKLVAELDITLLRPQAPGEVVLNGGDIDNRLKTLLDALRVPTSQEVKSGVMASSREKPIYTLLYDDRLITRVNVTTDRLLAPQDPDGVRLIIGVTVRTQQLIWGNLSLISS